MPIAHSLPFESIEPRTGVHPGYGNASARQEASESARVRVDEWAETREIPQPPPSPPPNTQIMATATTRQAPNQTGQQQPGCVSSRLPPPAALCLATAEVLGASAQSRSLSSALVKRWCHVTGWHPSLKLPEWFTMYTTWRLACVGLSDHCACAANIPYDGGSPIDPSCPSTSEPGYCLCSFKSC